VIRSLIKSIAALPRAETYDRAKAYALHDKLRPQMRSTKTLASREAVWDEAIALLGKTNPVLYLEFGVYQGYSIRYFSERLSSPRTALYGFDCFEGLPEQWGKIDRGTFSTGGAIPDIADSRVQFVKGLFQDTVPGFLAKLPREGTAPDQRPQVFVHFDADLYSSTLFLLTTLWHHFPTYHFCFDEFMGDELRALSDFSAAYPSNISFLACDLFRGYPGRMLGRLERKVSGSPT
jgi:O-methyltransferase